MTVADRQTNVQTGKTDRRSSLKQILRKTGRQAEVEGVLQVINDRKTESIVTEKERKARKIRKIEQSKKNMKKRKK